MAAESNIDHLALKTIDILYTEKDGPDPNASNPFITNHKTTSYTGGRGRGGHDSAFNAILYLII